MKFFETSAKESTNVSEAFITMTRDIIKLVDKKLIPGFYHKAAKKIVFSNESTVLKKYINF